MSKFITFIVSITTAIAILLLSVAAMLIWAPELLLDILRVVIIGACIIAGLCMLIPALIVLVTVISGAVQKQMKTHHQVKENA